MSAEGRFRVFSGKSRPRRRRRANGGREAPPIRRSGSGSLAARSFPLPSRAGPLELLRSVFSFRSVVACALERGCTGKSAPRARRGPLPLNTRKPPSADTNVLPLRLCVNPRPTISRRDAEAQRWRCPAFWSPCGANTKRHESRLRRTRNRSVSSGVERPSAIFVSRRVFVSFVLGRRPSEGVAAVSSKPPDQAPRRNYRTRHQAPGTRYPSSCVFRVVRWPLLCFLWQIFVPPPSAEGEWRARSPAHSAER